MTAVQEASGGHVPAHVPEDLVYEFLQEVHPDFPVDPYGTYKKLQQSAPEVFWSPTSLDGNGVWMVTSFALCREVLQEHKRFTTTIDYSPGNAWPRRLIPLELDPPDHQKYRSLLTPLFAPAAVDRLEAGILATTNELIDRVIGDGGCDFVDAFARMLPGTIFIQLLGLPVAMRDQCFAWEETFFHSGTPEERAQVGVDIQRMLIEHIESKRADPGDDLVSQLTKASVDGKPIEDEYIQDMCFLLFIAGLDTVTSGLGHSFRYLAEHPDKKQQLRDNPELIPAAVEELLRWHSWVNVPRTVRVDTELGGVSMKQGDHVQVVLTLADRDPLTFDAPDEVDFERAHNPHLAFAGGVHRCVGSHLARRELRVAVEQWLRRVPDFRVREHSEPLDYNPYGMFSVKYLPLEWTVPA
ncbi:MAG TPA: cytochrome P450 [Acidimicrobiales bacterium]|nr:cytochrome P450 [Acidimicrobiales bacterium]